TTTTATTITTAAAAVTAITIAVIAAIERAFKGEYECSERTPSQYNHKRTYGKYGHSCTLTSANTEHESTFDLFQTELQQARQQLAFRTANMNGDGNANTNGRTSPRHTD
ncbi:hypothetical protein SARC_09115, partial [Sphaeroforma arctica JP610]